MTKFLISLKIFACGAYFANEIPYFANFGQPPPPHPPGGIPHLGNPYIKIIKSLILYNSAQICIMQQSHLFLTVKYNGDIFRTHVCPCMSRVTIRNNISQRNKHYNTVCRKPTKHQYYSRHRNTINNSGSTQHHKYNIHAVSYCSEISIIIQYSAN